MPWEWNSTLNREGHGGLYALLVVLYGESYALNNRPLPFSADLLRAVERYEGHLEVMGCLL